MIGPTEYLRIAVDPVRLAVLGAAAQGPVDTQAVADALGIDERRVRREIGRLVEGGLVRRDLTLDTDALRAIAQALPQDAPMDPDLADGPWTGEEAQVLGRFFSGGRLVSIPTQHAKRLLVLERLAPEGVVRIGDELWKARSDVALETGTEVEIMGVDRLTLRVRPRAKEART